MKKNKPGALSIPVFFCFFFFNPSNLALLSDPGATAGLGFIVSDMISGQVGTKEDMTCGFSNFTRGPTGDPLVMQAGR